jgi:hypothetical protein
LPPIPGKQVGQLALRLASDAGEHIGQPCLRVDLIELRGLCRPPNYAEWFERLSVKSVHL